MAKKKAEKPAREVTKRQLSRWHQQRKRQRIITAAGIFVLATVLILVGVGWYVTQYRPLHQTVIVVNGTEYDMDYYIKMLEIYGEGDSVFLVADDVVNRIKRNELARQIAKNELGITVSKDEVRQALQGRELPADETYRDLIESELLMAKLRDSYFEQMVPKSAEQGHLMAMFLENESQVLEVRSKIENGEDFAELASELSLDSLTREQKGDLDWQVKDVLDVIMGSPVLGDYLLSAGIGELSQPLYDAEKAKNIGYWIVQVLDREEDSDEADVQAMLLGNEAEAQEIKAELEADEDQDFATLAKEYSQLRDAEENGGYLGLVTSGTITQALDEAVFDSGLEVGILSEPIRDEGVVTKGGHWLVKVLDKDDDRPIKDIDRDLLKAKTLNDWLVEVIESPENVVRIYLGDEQKMWAINRVIGG